LYGKSYETIFFQKGEFKMKKRILGLALALVMIISLLPAVTVLPVKAATVSKTINLWGTTAKIDNDDATTDVPAALYWKTEEGSTELPVAVTDPAAGWNISFAIVDGKATLTLKDVTFDYDQYFLSLPESYAGALDIVYQGTNNIKRTTTANSGTLFYAYASKKKPNIKFIGGKDDVLNLSGNGRDSYVVNFNFGDHNDATGSSVSFIGGTVNITRTNAGKYGAVKLVSCNVLIENCNWNVTSKKGVSANCQPAVMFVPETNAKERTTIIRNSNVKVDTSCLIGILLGNQKTTGALGTKFETLQIEGKSNVIVNVANVEGKATYAHGGIVAKDIIVRGGALEVKATTSVDGATMNAIELKGEGVTAPNLTEYVGQYNMYLEEEGEPVTAFAASAYFKVEFKPCATHAGKVTDCTKDAPCTNPGCPEKFYTAPANAAHQAGDDDGDCTTGIKCKNCQVIVTEGAASHKDTRTDCAVAGTCANAGCTHAFAAGQHNPAADDGDCTTDIKCASCGKVAVKGQTAHKYTDKNDTTCDNAGCTKTRTVDGTENPKTGDNTALVLVATLMVAAAAAFVTTKKFVR
jgi:hypothetical protein